MEERHPIDKLFKEGLRDPDIPFDPRDWETLSKKMHPRKKRKIPVLVWFTSGVAAAMLLAAILLVSDRQAPVEDIREYTTGNPQRDTPATAQPHKETAEDTASVSEKPIHEAPLDDLDYPIVNTVSSYTRNVAALPMAPLSQVQSLRPATVYPGFSSSIDGNQIPAVARIAPRAISSDDTASRLPDERLPGKPAQKGWALSVIAAPDLSGTRPMSGKLSGNVGLIATYRVNQWLSISGGALYAKKLYQADFADYRPNVRLDDRKGTPNFIEADCGVLDIPILANIAIKQFNSSSLFVSGGISSYLMLRETYSYRYPPHEYRYPQQFTLHNQNRHLLGVGNLSVGYRRQLHSSLSLTVQPFVKVPLTGIGNGNIKLYSTGVAISADIDLSRRDK